MSTTTAAPQTYTAILADARITAIRALTEILATSDDPTERRHAATAILRAPDPEPPKPLAAAAPSRPPFHPPGPLIDPHAIIPGTNTTVTQILMRAKQVLEEKLESQRSEADRPHTRPAPPSTPIPQETTSPAAQLAAAAGCAAGPS